MVVSNLGVGMGENGGLFDTSRFVQRLKLQALRVPKQLCGRVSKLLTGCVVDMPRVKHIVPDPGDENSRLVILSDSIKDPSLREIPEGKLRDLKELVNIDVVPHDLLLGYEHWSAEHVLRELLPPECEVPTSFETVGHIAHLNLRDEHFPYKSLIGKVLLDKNHPRVRTILNKVGTITNEFRVPSFELLAGEDQMVAEVKQYGATFHLDYSQVYWNSRLEHEHKRLVSEFRPGQVVCDMFAGVGPFAIPAALGGCLVYANDLNPASVKYLDINAEINKVKRRVFTYNMDARKFMQDLVNPATPVAPFMNKPVTQQEQERAPVVESKSNEHRTKVKRKQQNKLEEPAEVKPWEHFDHVVMNLPASAITFLDVFKGLLSRSLWKGSMPRIHCYCFMNAKQNSDDIIKIAETTIGGSLPDVSIWTVRFVAPNKPMLCLSFTLPESIAFGAPDGPEEEIEPKRPRTM